MQRVGREERGSIWGPDQRMTASSSHWTTRAVWATGTKPDWGSLQQAGLLGASCPRRVLDFKGLSSLSRTFKHAGGGGGSNRMQSQIPVSNRFLLEERLPPRWVRDDVLLDLVGSPELPGENADLSGSRHWAPSALLRGPGSSSVFYHVTEQPPQAPLPAGARPPARTLPSGYLSANTDDILSVTAE
ncbi:hypothetical protein CB1_000526047 [Camelus ferus]|nr:hypothetical protein CB1_000526047 [Camelus ferus]